MPGAIVAWRNRDVTLGILDLGDPSNRGFLYLALGFPLLLITWRTVAGRIFLSWERLLKSYRDREKPCPAALAGGEPRGIN